MKERQSLFSIPQRESLIAYYKEKKCPFYITIFVSPLVWIHCVIRYQRLEIRVCWGEFLFILKSNQKYFWATKSSTYQFGTGLVCNILKVRNSTHTHTRIYNL